MRRLPAAVTVAVPVLVLGLVLGTAAATAATPNDAACRKAVSGSVSHTELLAYDACRFDKLDAAVKAITPTDTPSSAASPTPTTSPTVSTSPTSAPGGTVLFSDDFSGAAGASYDHAKWGEWSAATYNSSAAYGNIKPGDRARLDGDGHLSIPATPDQGTSISTKDDFTFTYGTITARMKVQTQSGYWPSFWTLNSPADGSGAPLVGEADLIEGFTKYPDGYRSAAHNYDHGNDNGPHDNPLCGSGNDVRGKWHDYSARIEPGKVTFSFDGKVCWAFDSHDADLAGNKPYGFGPDNPAGNWLLLTNAVGNSSQGMEAPTQNSVLLVDRVTVTSL
jgi:beta-glucanase (GH16 family)